MTEDRTPGPDTPAQGPVVLDGVELDRAGVRAAAEVVVCRDYGLGMVNSPDLEDYLPQSKTEFWEFAARVVAAYLKETNRDAR